ncbi:hypothetical protein [Butyrivibrio sp. INlla21]|uniref:hypothetical protein n=1 Tax=Butyrivibrio sp. INlla21 TaxID=1520811 RepID=UPI0008ED4A44|nr:hypothetical protein [Butyrivibrio sp. INlla21]SFU49005.1 hypothetical protein SAMN02910342_00689 [Butyrivibrio sp. INlla21]
MKIVRSFFCCIAFLIIIIGVFMLINGSLEMYPTSEQIEKSRITGLLFIIVGMIAAFLLIKRKR